MAWCAGRARGSGAGSRGWEIRTGRQSEVVGWARSTARRTQHMHTGAAGWAAAAGALLAGGGGAPLLAVGAAGWQLRLWQSCQLTGNVLQSPRGDRPRAAGPLLARGGGRSTAGWREAAARGGAHLAHGAVIHDAGDLAAGGLADPGVDGGGSGEGRGLGAKRRLQGAGVGGLQAVLLVQPGRVGVADRQVVGRLLQEGRG